MSAQSPSKIPSPRAHGYHYDHDSSLLLNQDALEAHRQVLEMSATIEILTRDFDQQQKELIEAYKRLNEYALWDPQRQVSNSSITQPIVTNNSMNSGFKDMENYENEKAMEEYKRVIAIKDSALTQALQQRNEYKIQLEKAEAYIKELRGIEKEGICTIKEKSRFSSGSNVDPSTNTQLPLGVGINRYPLSERFDEENAYQKLENDSIFWKKQYREAVRMRKHPGQLYERNIPRLSSKQPSLNIFSAPNNMRRKGITDEFLPLSRYIGISTRQNNIIKEQHRMLDDATSNSTKTVVITSEMKNIIGHLA